ncbi:MAG: hypothetical protein KBG46_08295 [Paracoccus sp.]|nr:hypothetical protein [Paracoccus sp. (in: a-proteobacteria)]
MDEIDLCNVIADVRQRTAEVWLNADEAAKGDHRRRWELVRGGESELAEYLRATYDAKIIENSNAITIRMCGVSSSATAGLNAAFTNWANAAARRVDAS